MLVSSDFLGHLTRKRELEKKDRPLVSATLESPKGGNEKAQPLEPASSKRGGGRAGDEVEYLNERSSTVSVVL
jgi:hypothetical protein